MSELAPAVMIQGTASGVGKSLLATALCRLYARKGLTVRPFKAQNMSNNSAVTVEGGEIGRAQWLQAVAARAQPEVRMNPVLLKPIADTRSDVVLLGRSDRALGALPWHERREALWPPVEEALASLRREADVVVIEGAGSPAETNLRRSDIVNMSVANAARACVLLVADIDRGGAFAALYGTWSLLSPEDRRLFRGFILNRFRGDVSLLSPAPEDLRELTGVPVVGVVPYHRHRLPEEDAVGIRAEEPGELTIAAVRLPHISNFDDLDPLAAEPGVRVVWTDRPSVVRVADAVVIPGTRNTLADLRWCWESGIAAAVRAAATAGTPVVGLCGGYQVLGVEVTDPHGVEDGGRCDGLGLLDVHTELADSKVTRQTRACVVDEPVGLPSLRGERVQGYEIHHGRTTLGPGGRPWLTAEPGGAVLGAHAASVWGCYLHGLFANDGFRRQWLAALEGTTTGEPWRSTLEREIDRLADLVDASLDPGFLDGCLDPAW